MPKKNKTESNVEVKREISKIKYNDEIGKWNKIKTSTKRKTSNAKRFDSHPKLVGICFIHFYAYWKCVEMWPEREMFTILFLVSFVLSFWLLFCQNQHETQAKAACALQKFVLSLCCETQIPLPIPRVRCVV